MKTMDTGQCERERTRLLCEGCLDHNLLVWPSGHHRGSQEPTPASMAEDQLSTPAWADLAAVYLKHHYLMLLINWLGEDCDGGDA